MWTHQQGVRAELEADPDLLEWEVWQLFEVEGGEVSLATIDGGNRHSWSSGLVELAAAGRLDRDRLLDASLEALARDFSAHQAGWFSRFHEALAPTAEERAARAEAYLGLVSSPAPATVTFAVKALLKAPAVDPGALIDALPAALASDRKGVVRDALKLLDRLEGDERAVAAAAALQHPAPDVQLRALELIAKWTGGEPSEDVRAELLAYAEIVAPTARGAFDALTGAPAVVADEPADLSALEAARPPARGGAGGAGRRRCARRAATTAGAGEPVLGDALRRSTTSTRSPTCWAARCSSARRTRTSSARSTASPASATRARRSSASSSRCSRGSTTCAFRPRSYGRSPLGQPGA